MVEYIADEILRNALLSGVVGKITREKYFFKDSTPIPFDNICAGVTYSVANSIFVMGEALIGNKIRNKNISGVISLSDQLHYESECKTVEVEFALEDKIVPPYCGLKPVQGILIDNYKDIENCYSMNLSKVVIRYNHKEGRIQSDLYGDVLSRDDLEKIEIEIAEQFEVDSIHDGSYDIGSSGRRVTKTEVTRVFTKEFLPQDFTVDRFLKSIYDVHLAGKQFKDGIKTLRNQSRRRSGDSLSVFAAFEL